MITFGSKSENLMFYFIHLIVQSRFRHSSENVLAYFYKHEMTLLTSSWQFFFTQEKDWSGMDFEFKISLLAIIFLFTINEKGQSN